MWEVLVKETLASLAIFGYGNQSVAPNDEAKKLFEGYVDILKTVLPTKLGFKNIKVMIPEVMICSESGDFPLDAVSGGISSIIDITWQIYMFGDKKDRFVVLIDEPENHLHPELQRTFLGNLINTFPNVQFVVATHNPFMITSQKDSFVYVLDYDEYKKMKARLELLEMLAESEEDVRNGRVAPIKDSFDDIRKHLMEMQNV